jgi:aldehyde:ferredoxin oxidoreductase
MAKTVFIDLTEEKIEYSETKNETLRKYLGGRGYAGKLLFDSTDSQVDPLSPDNALIFSIGLFGGTNWPTSGRGHVTFKSPLTGGYGHANSGGTFGAELARSGYDAVVISGRSPVPVYLFITPDTIEIRNAENLWGLEVSHVSEQLEPEGKVACIGPAGENLVRFAAIMNDRNRAAARCGGGAVMGSKKLKAVVVKAASGRVLPDGYKQIGKEVFKRIHEDSRLNSLRRYGTSNLVDIQNMAGSMPSKNHQTVQVSDVSKIEASALDKYVLKGKGCYACPIKCGRVSEVPEGKYACKTGGPEYESIAALGPMTLIDDIEAIIYANLRCNELGLDTISTGAVIAFAMECHEKGLLDDPNLTLNWNDPESVLGLIEEIARRQDIGDILAEGSRLAAAEIGGDAEKYAMQVKGLELPRQDPRVAKGFGFGHAVSNRGADHLYALPTIDAAGLRQVAEKYFSADIVEDLLDTDIEKYKPDEVVLGEHFCAIVDSLGLCKLISSENYCITPEDLARGLRALWEEDITAEDLLIIGERIVNMERLYNVMHGFTRKDDYLPERFTEEPVDIRDVGASGKLIRSGAVLKSFEEMLDRYYELRGWDRNGVPTETTLDRLKISEYKK